MRTAKRITELLSWRWTPFVALVFGSLFYVALMLLLIPNKLGESKAKERDVLGSTLGNSNPSGLQFGNTIRRASHREEDTNSEATHELPPTVPQPAADMNQRRGFSPPLSRPEPEPPPEAPPSATLVSPPPPAPSPAPEPPPTMPPAEPTNSANEE